MKQKVVVVVASVLCVLAASCGEESRDMLLGENQSFIVGGSATAALPAIGLIAYEGYPQCTGTLIEPNKVLTAGHCLSGFSAAAMKFAIGSSTSDLKEVIQVKSIHPHPYFSMGSSVENDIGIMILEKAATTATPLKVNTTAMTSSWVGTKLLFLGYGVTDGYNQTGDGTKRVVEIPIAQVASKVFSYGVAGKNTCSGDSGGPALVKDSAGNFLVAGVTSYGDRYCTSYGVDTRVDAFLSFVGISNTDSNTTPPPATGSASSGGCQGETFEGRCSGDQLVWCESNQVKVADCKNECGWDTSKEYYNCL